MRDGRDGPQGLRVASLGRRVCAGLIDTVAFVPPIVAVCVGGGWLYIRYGPRRGLELDEVRPFAIPGRWKVVIWVVSGVVRVRIRNRRTPGTGRWDCGGSTSAPAGR